MVKSLGNSAHPPTQAGHCPQEAWPASAEQQRWSLDPRDLLLGRAPPPAEGARPLPLLQTWGTASAWLGPVPALGRALPASASKAGPALPTGEARDREQRHLAPRPGSTCSCLGRGSSGTAGALCSWELPAPGHGPDPRNASHWPLVPTRGRCGTTSPGCPPPSPWVQQCWLCAPHSLPPEPICCPTCAREMRLQPQGCLLGAQLPLLSREDATPHPSLGWGSQGAKPVCKQQQCL